MDSCVNKQSILTKNKYENKIKYNKKLITQKWLIILSILLSLNLFFSCETTEPPPPVEKVDNTIILKTEWQDFHRISLKWNASEKDKEKNYLYKLIRTDKNGTQQISVFNMKGDDTTYIDDNNGDSLKMGESYSYKVEAYNKTNELKDTSNTLHVSTLSITSHDFTWEIDTLGQGGDYLYDVWGTDENSVWAVGGIETNEGRTAIIKWDGKSWNYHSWPEGHLVGIYGFNKNDIWAVGEYSNRGFLGHFDGSNWTEYRSDYFYSRGDTVYSLRAVWGSSSSDVWAVGLYGTIIHWDGNEWTKVKSPDIYHLNDIWGSSSDNIYAVVYSLSGNSRVIRYNGEKWSAISNELPNEKKGLISIWVDKTGKGYTVGTKTYSFVGNDFSSFSINKTSFLECVRGSSSNNVFISGQYGGIHHYNGMDWKRYDELFSIENNELNSMQVFENHAFIVGYTNQNTIIIRGERK